MGQFTQGGVIYEELPNGQVRVVGHAQQGPQAGAIPIGPRNNRQANEDARAAAADKRAADAAARSAAEWNAKNNPDGTPKDAEGGLSPEAITFNADQYLATGVMPTLGMGKQAAKDRERILNAAAAQAGATGLKGPDLARQIAHYRAGTKQVATLEGQLGQLRGSEQTALANGQQFLDRSRELPGQTGYPFINSVVQTAQRWLPIPGHETIAAADVARNTFANEYARVISQTGGSGGVLSDSARNEALSIMRGDYSQEQKQHAYDQMRADMANRLASSHQSINDAYAGLTQKPGYTMPETIADIQGGNKKQDQTNPFAALPSKGGGTPGLYDDGGNFIGEDPNKVYQPGEEMPPLTGYVHGGPGADGSSDAGPAQANPYEAYLRDQLTKNGMADPNSANNLGARAGHGLLASLDDEIAGLGGGLGYALRGKNPITGYEINRDVERMRQHQNKAGQGGLGTAVEVASSIPTALLMGGGPGISGAMANGARFGATEGFGRGAGLTGSALSAVGGAIGGTAGGAAGGAIGKYAVAPLARKLTNTPFVRSALERVSRGNFEPVPNPTPIESAFNKAGPDLGSVIDNLKAAQGQKLPYALADADPRLRLLAGSVSRQSPETGAIAENYLEPRQMGQIDRLRQSIGDNLAPETNVTQRGKDLLKAGNVASSPYYTAANMRAAPIDDELKAMLQTRAGQDAMVRARGIAENLGRDPNKMGFNLDNQGEVSIEHNPSFETLDLIKKGFDAKIYDGANPITGPDFNGNPELGALNQYRKRYVSKLDSLNPDYPKARAEYAKYAQQKDALDAGYGTLPNALPRDVQSYVAGQSGQNLAEAQRGYATALSDRAQKLSDTRDPFKAVYGSPASREKIAMLFPNGAPRFDQHYGLENDMAKTAREVLGGSQTAQRTGMDAAFNNMAVPAEIAGSLHGVPGAGTTALKGLSYLTRRGIQGAARKNAETLAPVLFSDAEKMNAIGLIQDMLANNARRTGAANATARRSGLFGSVLAPVPALDSR